MDLNHPGVVRLRKETAEEFEALLIEFMGFVRKQLEHLGSKLTMDELERLIDELRGAKPFPIRPPLMGIAAGGACTDLPRKKPP